jgi:hypothetical protein
LRCGTSISDYKSKHRDYPQPKVVIMISKSRDYDNHDYDNLDCLDQDDNQAKIWIISKNQHHQ